MKLPNLIQSFSHIFISRQFPASFYRKQRKHSRISDQNASARSLIITLAAYWGDGR